MRRSALADACVSCENWERLDLQCPSKNAIVIEHNEDGVHVHGIRRTARIFVGNCETGLYAFHNSLPVMCRRTHGRGIRMPPPRREHGSKTAGRRGWVTDQNPREFPASRDVLRREVDENQVDWHAPRCVS